MGRKVDLNAPHKSNSQDTRNSHHQQTHPQQPQQLQQSSEMPENTSPTKNKTDKPSKLEQAKLALKIKQGKQLNEQDLETLKKSLKDVKILMPLKIKIIMSLSLIIVLAILALALYSSLMGNKISGGSGMSLGGYYVSKCSEVTVIFVDEKRNPTGSGTYSLTDYVAGVVASEVGGFNNLEVYKALAIAARTYGEKVYSSDCSIEDSPYVQTFDENVSRDNPIYDLIYQAVDETEGMMVLDSNGEIILTQYDALSIASQDENYYTLSQANQKIPTEWMEKTFKAEQLEYYKNNQHGQGLSQWGAYYLATEQDKKYDEIIEFYYGYNQEIQLSTENYTGVEFLSQANLEIKNTTNSKALTGESLSSYLESKGSSINNLAAYVHKNVEEVGVGTREGVVTAAISLINYLYDNYNIRIPYYWGGAYDKVGVNGNWGASTTPVTSKYGSTFNYSGLDCSGFASWAIKNGGYNFSRVSTAGFHSNFSSDSCNVTNNNCIGQPGDLINSQSCHVQLIVAVDTTSGKYIIAESTGSYGLIVREQNIHSGNCGSAQTLILHMDNYYNNSDNVNTSY